jgi:hypothetical protein
VTVSSRQQRTNKLDQLIEAKAEPDTILRAAALDIKAIQSNYWRSSNQRYAKQLTKQMVDKLKMPEGRQKLIGLLEPGDGAGEMRRLEFGGQLEMLGENDRATGIYEEVLKNNPKRSEARNRLLVLTAEKSPERATAMLMELPWEMMAQGTGATLVNGLYSGDLMNFQARMTLLEAFAAYLDKLAVAPPPRGALEWALHLQDAAANYDNTTSLPRLFYRNQQGYRPIEANQKRRLQVHETVCRAVMKHPEIAEGPHGVPAAGRTPAPGSCEEQELRQLLPRSADELELERLS